METYTFLKQFEMFMGLDDEALKKVFALCTPKRYKSDTIIVEKDAPPHNFYLLKDGTVNVYTTTIPDQTGSVSSVVVTLGTGQSFGEMGLVDKGLRSATVRSVTSLAVFVVNCKKFMALCETDTSLGFQVMRNIASDLSFKLRNRNLM